MSAFDPLQTFGRGVRLADVRTLFLVLAALWVCGCSSNSTTQVPAGTEAADGILLMAVAGDLPAFERAAARCGLKSLNRRSDGRSSEWIEVRGSTEKLRKSNGAADCAIRWVMANQQTVNFIGNAARD